MKSGHPLSLNFPLSYHAQKGDLRNLLLGWNPKSKERKLNYVLRPWESNTTMTTRCLSAGQITQAVCSIFFSL